MPTHDGSGIYQGLLKGTLRPPRWESVIFLLALCSSSHLPMKHKTIEILIVLLTGDFYGEGGKKPPLGVKSSWGWWTLIHCTDGLEQLDLVW